MLVSLQERCRQIKGSRVQRERETNREQEEKKGTRERIKITFDIWRRQCNQKDMINGRRNVTI